MNSSISRILASAICAAALTACATLSPQPPAEWDGLERRDVKGLDSVYVRPNVQFPAYKKVMLDPVQVEFSKDWDPNSSSVLSRRLNADDIQKIKDTLAGLVKEGFTAELLKGGYTLTVAPDADTIRVSAAIINLYITAPDVVTAGRSTTYTTEAGSMTLAMEVRDSPTGQLLARVVDARRADNAGGRMQWTNSVTNRADAERIISIWARKLRDGLDKLNGKAG